MAFDSTGHRRRCLAGTDDDQANCEGGGQVTGNTQRRLRSGGRRIEHIAQLLAWIA
jgi:hypothetical protein